MNRDFDRIAITCQRFVNRVINYFVNQMMQSQLAGRTDVHRGTLAHGIAALEHGYRRRVVSFFLRLNIR